MEYYGQYRSELLPFVPKSEKALEIGCSEGLFGAQLKQNQLVKEIWGVELVPQVAEKAKEKLDRVFSGCISDNFEQLKKESFDLFIFNDVLEHIDYPEKLLEEIKELARPGARIFASIPNVRHWRTMQEYLFKKDWEYKDHGVLDCTHLRFFTKKSMQRFFAKLGMEIEVIQGVNHKKNWLFWVLNILTLGSHRDIQYLQYAVVAKVK